MAFTKPTRAHFTLGADEIVAPRGARTRALPLSLRARAYLTLVCLRACSHRVTYIAHARLLHTTISVNTFASYVLPHLLTYSLTHLLLTSYYLLLTTYYLLLTTYYLLTYILTYLPTYFPAT